MENIIKLIESVGFPIVCAIVLAKCFHNKYNNLEKRYNDLIDKLINKK